MVAAPINVMQPMLIQMTPMYQMQPMYPGQQPMQFNPSGQPMQLNIESGQPPPYGQVINVIPSAGASYEQMPIKISN